MMKLSEIDAVLVRYADSLSPAAISFKIEGILTPEQVMTRIGQLLDSPDWLTSAQQDRLVTLKMRQLIAELEEMPLNPRVAEILIRALEALGSRLERRAVATDRDLSVLYAFQGSVMLDSIEKALSHMRRSLTGGNPVAEKQWDDALETALRFAQMEIGRHEADYDPDKDTDTEPLQPIDIPSKPTKPKQQKELV